MERISFCFDGVFLRGIGSAGDVVWVWKWGDCWLTQQVRGRVICCHFIEAGARVEEVKARICELSRSLVDV
ncbi:MAG: hypothetical protein ACRCYV_11865 [Aeromonas sp.]